jgi:uncharacterized protein (DUF1786 family)
MHILCVDVGTGTQDLLLYDSERELENAVQLILPSPTRIVADKIRKATMARRPVLLTGRIMGGGPCAWAAEDHLRHGLAVYATPDAARTFDDEPEKVERMGVRIVGDDDAARMGEAERIAMGDLDYAAIAAVLGRFGVELDPAAVAVAVFHHGDAPPGVSDRVFRFDYIAATVARDDLAAFAYPGPEVPERLTRMRAVADSIPAGIPALVMDTGPAAILGALEDPVVAAADDALIANLGNFHTLAFHLAGGKVRGLFEHHTGELTRAELERYLRQLGDGTISNAEVFADMGHGALVVGPSSRPPDFLAVTGPRRSLLSGSDLHPYLAVPHGAMMVAGCFGLLRALAKRLPAFAGAVEERLGASPHP